MNISKDNVNPAHYKDSTSLECIEVMEVCVGYEAVANFCLCNAFKYMWRYKHKNGSEDIKKAGWYLDWIEHKINLNYTFSNEFLKNYERIKDLYITIGDKLSNNK